MKIFKNIKNFYLLWKNFNFGIASAELKVKLLRNNESVSYKRYEKIKAYIRSKYGNIIDNYAQLSYDVDSSAEKHIEKNCPIWIFWYQGLESAPDIVKMCVESVRRNAGDHPVIIITRSNFAEYVSLPEHILTKVASGKISLTHFSDILRFNLLAAHGGIYLDSTVFVTNMNGNNVFDWCNYSLYTCHTEIRPDTDIAKGLWVSYIFAAGWGGNPFARYMVDMFNAYWENENMLITYLMIDCMIALAYENISWAKEMIDAVPANNQNIYVLADNANEAFNDELYTKAISCPFHKMTYKKEFLIESNGSKTIWGKFIEDFN